MQPHDETPREMADKLDLTIDLTRYMSPAIVGASGKRHYYAHGGGFGQFEVTDVLRRLLRIRAAQNPNA